MDAASKTETELLVRQALRACNRVSTATYLLRKSLLTYRALRMQSAETRQDSAASRDRFLALKNELGKQIRPKEAV